MNVERGEKLKGEVLRPPLLSLQTLRDSARAALPERCQGQAKTQALLPSPVLLLRGWELRCTVVCSQAGPHRNCKGELTAHPWEVEREKQRNQAWQRVSGGHVDHRALGPGGSVGFGVFFPKLLAVKGNFEDIPN